MTWILLLSILGLLDAGYLAYKSYRREAPVCPLGHSCAFVLDSAYNRMFGVKNEMLGLAFYAVTIVAVLGTMLGVVAIPPWLWLLGFTGALAASLVLTVLQVFVLHAYCSWCLASAVINAFLLTVGWTVFR